ncbi:DUF3750 domain-containing protein [Halomonas sp. PAMB 3264]|uniref:DUF3750 domain-containing protein n=1 Tax=Halomonas sp. PAMB 3264 TaxID=3075222 RepID=UPI002896CD94|nr:DUF3750 domain-containing protein [Halomonas sp. PAMB 3264]WNL40719.1 DUF3750 domain-containing protein [Halomonas sp. PAMB 3264]
MKTLFLWLLTCVLMLALLLAGPAWLLLTDRVESGGHWSSANRDSAGLAPLPEAYAPAVVQVYAARAFSWRGAFGVHIWIATKAEGAPNYRLHQVLSWRRPTVVSASDTPDRAWFGQAPTLLADYRGSQAARLIPLIEDAATRYPQVNLYRVWPGPNSNSFIAWMVRQIDGLDMALPVTAVGKDYLFGSWFAATPSGTGYQFSLGGVFCVMFAWEEGVELNLLGLSLGVDVLRPALKLPGIGRIGMTRPVIRHE